MSYSLVDNFESGESSSSTMDAVNDWAAQTFTASKTYTITRLSVYVAKAAGGDAGTATVSLKAVNGSGIPTGADLTSGTFAASTCVESPSYGWIDVDVTEYEVTEGTQYAIVVRADSASGGNALYWRDKSTDPAYADGARFFDTDGGASWNGPFTGDMYFRTYETPAGTYVDASATMAGVSTFAATGTVVGFKDASAAMAGTSVFAATGTVTRTSTGIQNNPGRTLRRLVAINNNCLYYEDI